MGEPIQSPCIKICCIEPQSKLCLGCYRTLPEIARWGHYSAKERNEIMSNLPSRLSQIDETYRIKP
ncbi:DUF1289 domain-containing protein [Candidatus Phycosocius spiralis]|uniref:DUF1289 domain-containing protein n=1 Tax=Candidatus Phycosocius spiralis TaxID=2815099 RepID=UPI002A4E1AA3|nr:DUF1289 domain-containing protein [Candidatus Phycosocius spiralis]